MPASATVSVSGTTATFGFVIPRGQDGLNGENGEPGVPGPPPAVGESTVETLEPGAQATVQTTYSSPTATFEFGIPRGATGSAGTTYTPVASAFSIAPDLPASASVTIDGGIATFSFGIPRGATGLSGTGGNGDNEYLGATITVNVPEAGDEDYVFGKLKNGSVLGIGDGEKTALDIIKEVLFAYNGFEDPTVTFTPSSATAGSNSVTVNITVSGDNANSNLGVTSDVKFYRKVGSGEFFPIGSVVGITASSYSESLENTYTGLQTDDVTYKGVVEFSDGDDQGERGSEKTYSFQTATFDPSFYTSVYLNNNTLGAGVATGNRDIIASSVENINYDSGASIQFKIETYRYTSGTNLAETTVAGTSTVFTGQGSHNFTLEDYPVSLANTANSGRREFKAFVREIINGATGDWFPAQTKVTFTPQYVNVTAPDISASPPSLSTPSGTVTFSGTVTNGNHVFGSTVQYQLRENNSLIDGTNNYSTASSISLSEDIFVDISDGEANTYRWYVDSYSTGIPPDLGSTITFSANTTGNSSPTLTSSPSLGSFDYPNDTVTFSGAVDNNNAQFSHEARLRLYQNSQPIYDSGWSGESSLDFNEQVEITLDSDGESNTFYARADFRDASGVETDTNLTSSNIIYNLDAFSPNTPTLSYSGTLSSGGGYRTITDVPNGINPNIGNFTVTVSNPNHVYNGSVTLRLKRRAINPIPGIAEFANVAQTVGAGATVSIVNNSAFDPDFSDAEAYYVYASVEDALRAR